jgi:hypothetical protein
MKHIIITVSYNSFAIPYTEAEAKALPDILSISKVLHKTGDIYTKDAVRPDLSIIIAEVENANN